MKRIKSPFDLSQTREPALGASAPDPVRSRAMWDVKSLCYRTELFVAAFDGVVDDHGDRLVVRTPSNPDFWWGNFLFYREPPTARSVEPGPDSWLEQFERAMPNASTTLFGWDAPNGARGEVEPFLARGFTLDETVVLSATKPVRPLRYDAAVAVEPIGDDADADWEAAAASLRNAFAPRRSGSLEDLNRFVDRQLVRYRSMQRAGVGQWFVARVDGEVAGTLGLVRCGDVGRFQLVGTDPRFARRGVCSTMVYEVARHGLEHEKLAALVMAADETYHAARVYESVGFERSETLIALVRKPSKA